MPKKLLIKRFCMIFFIKKALNYNFYIRKMPNQIVIGMKEIYPFGGCQLPEK